MQKNFTITHVGHTELIQPMPFIYIPAKGKTFMFQAHDSSNLGIKSEGIPITFENDFWMCAYQTTQEFWASVIHASDTKDLDPNPSYFKGKTRPVEQLSWNHIQIFNAALNSLFVNKGLIIQQNPQIGGQLCLPSETQWEYAAKANQNLVFSGSQNPNDVAWYRENSYNQTMPVGLKQPNSWGLYDMSGNVWEWCKNSFSENGSFIIGKTLRGGNFNLIKQNCQLKIRIHNRPYNKHNIYGFRLVFSL